MGTKRKAGIFAAAMAAVMILGMAMALPARATGIQMPGIKEHVLVDTASTPVNDTPAPQPVMEDVKITGYSFNVYDSDGKAITPQPSNITPGMSLDIIFSIEDSRSERGRDALQPVAKLNTPSFTRARHYNNNTGLDQYGDNAPMETRGRRYDITFPVTYTGTGNLFAFDLYYKSENGNDFKAVPMQTISHVLNQCVEKTEDPNSLPTSSEAIIRGTGFVLQSASYGASDITAGKSFALETVMLATNGDFDVENTSLTLALPKEIKLATGSSVSYIGTVAPNGAVTGNFDLITNANVEEGSYVITVKIQGISARDGTPVEASADITVPVVQPERFEISNPQVPEMVMMGSADGYGSMELVNKGIGAVYNVEVEITGDGLYAEEGKQYIGTIAGGSQNSADFNVMAETAGSLKGQVTVSYENARGEAKKLTHDFTVLVEDMGGGMDPGGNGGMEPMPMPEEQGGGLPLWLMLLIGLVVVGGVVAAVVVITKRRKAKRDAEFDDDYDDDDDFFSDTPYSAQGAAPPQGPGGQQ